MEMMKKKMGLKEYAKYEQEEYARKPAGEAMRPAIISDACGHMQPTRKNPGGFVGVWDFSGSNQTKKSPTSKPGNAGGKRII
jgi:hypothetical protein